MRVRIALLALTSIAISACGRFGYAEGPTRDSTLDLGTLVDAGVDQALPFDSGEDLGLVDAGLNDMPDTSLPDAAVRGAIDVFRAPTLETTEGGGTATFRLVLVSAPSADVFLGVTSGNTREGTVAPGFLTFTSSNWDTPQTVTVTGVDDHFVDGDQTYEIVTTSASSADPAYQALDVDDLVVTNHDDDEPGVLFEDVSGLLTTESGASAMFAMRLASEPASIVTISLASSDSGEGGVNPSLLTFNPLNWNVNQLVTVTGVDDLLADGDIVFDIVTGPAVSSDSDYDGLDVEDVTVTNSDNDMPGVTVSRTSGLSTTEAGTSTTFTLVLRSQPIDDVVIGISSSDPSEGLADVSTVSFTPSTWNTRQTVRVTGSDDFVDDGVVAYTIVTSATVSADPTYDGLGVLDVNVSNLDNDTAGINAPWIGSSLFTTEAGSQESISIALSSQPLSDVVLTLTSSDPQEGLPSPATLTFTAANWSTPQSVSITGQNDGIYDPDKNYTVMIEVASSDPTYEGMSVPSAMAFNQSIRSFLKAEYPRLSDLMGSAIALSSDGSTMAVGDPGEDSNALGINGDQSSISAPSSGAVFVYTRSGSDWALQAYIKASMPASTFGTSVAISSNGDTLAVGAENTGAVFVFTRVGATWTQQARVMPAVGGADFFGHSVAVSGDGDVLAVGAPSEDSSATGVGGNATDNSSANSGAAYTFTRAAGIWTQHSFIKASNTGSGDAFGSSVAISTNGSTLVVGAPTEDSSATGIGGDQLNNSALESGAVYVFAQSAGVWAQQAYVKASNTDANDQFGNSVATSGTGDAVAVGAPNEASSASTVGGLQTDNGLPYHGAVYSFARIGVSWSQDAYIKPSDNDARAMFGWSVAMSQDGNWLIAGARFEPSGWGGLVLSPLGSDRVYSGAAYVFSRSGGSFSQIVCMKPWFSHDNDEIGFAVAMSSDHDTIAMGGRDSNGAGFSGAVYVTSNH